MHISMEFLAGGGGGKLKNCFGLWGGGGGGGGGGGSIQDITSGYVSKRDCIILVLTSQFTWKYIDYYSFIYFL
jgi:uncharacterized spore protein YtfJ